jgi:hypothetical protein
MFGVLAYLVLCFTLYFVPPLLGYVELRRPFFFASQTVFGTNFFIGRFLLLFIDSMIQSLLWICALFLLKILLRNQKITFAVIILIFPLTLSSGNIWQYLIYAGLVALWLFVLMRFGLVASLFAIFTTNFFQIFPITYEATAWYAKTGLAALIIFTIIILYAFRTSLGGRPMFGTPKLDE